MTLVPTAHIANLPHSEIQLALWYFCLTSIHFGNKMFHTLRASFCLSCYPLLPVWGSQWQASLLKICLVTPRSLPQASRPMFRSAGSQWFCATCVVTGSANLVFSRYSTAIEIELNQDSVNLSQIRFELCDCVIPGNQEVQGGPAVVEGKERNQVLGFFPPNFRHRRPMHEREEISFMYR